MPYIKQEDRERLYLRDGRAEAPGDLAYLVYCLVVDWVYGQGGKLSYTKASAAIGVLDTVKDEFRRRHLDFYEDQKIVENGDVSIAECQNIAEKMRNGNKNE